MRYAAKIGTMLEELKSEYKDGKTDAVLAVKDILAHEMKKENNTMLYGFMFQFKLFNETITK